MQNQQSSLEKEYKYFINNYEELVKNYESKYVVIKNDSVLGAYDSIEDAILETRKTEALGTFLVKKCDSNKENYTQTFNTRVSFKN